MEKINCNFCSSAENKIITTQTDIIYKTTSKNFNVVECLNCGLNFVNPRPSEEEIGDYYKTDYQFHKSSSYFKVLLRKITKYIANSKLSIFATYLPILNEKLKYYVQKEVKNPIKLKKNDFFLDVGAGSANMSYFWDYEGSLNYYKSKTNNIFAVEPGDTSLKQLKENNITSFKLIDDVPKNLSFDVIRMNWSLEHVHDPKKYFEFFKNNLQKNGKVLLCIPNYNGLLYQLDKSQVELPIHLYHFKKNDIQNYCKSYGLKVLEFQTLSLASMFYAVSKYNSKFKQFSNLSLLDLNNLQKLLNKFDDFELGSDMLFIIGKN